MMTYNIKPILKALDKLVTTEKAAVTRATSKAAKLQRPALLSFDDVESMAVPDKKSVRIIISSPNVDDATDEAYNLSTVINAEAERTATNMLNNVMQEVRRILK